VCQCTLPPKGEKIKMSTHALITISKDKELKDYDGTYVHMDGYGEGLGDFLIVGAKEYGIAFIRDLIQYEWRSLSLDNDNKIDFNIMYEKGEFGDNRSENKYKNGQRVGSFKFHEMDFGHEYVYNFWKDEKIGSWVMDAYKKVWAQGWDWDKDGLAPSEMGLIKRIVFEKQDIKYYNMFNSDSFATKEAVDQEITFN
tara:strand:- start:283 stop:873 length:591 start_codon:yes stop_codon:yes gene_type:complete